MTRAEDALAAIQEFTQDHGYPPTVRELGSALGVTSSATVFRLLEQLRDDGKVVWNPNLSRTLRVVKNVERDVGNDG